MKIILNGQAGTNAHAITKKLAERLSLDCITATSFFPQRCFNDRGNLLPEFRLHNDEEVDKMVDAKLKEELAKHPNNFILNSYNGLFLVPDALRILLVIDVQSKPSLAAIDGVRRADLDMAYKGAYIESNYDIIINTFDCSNEEVVDCIMQALESGKYGKYVPLNILLPIFQVPFTSNIEGSAFLYLGLFLITLGSLIGVVGLASIAFLKVLQSEFLR